MCGGPPSAADFSPPSPGRAFLCATGTCTGIATRGPARDTDMLGHEAHSSSVWSVLPARPRSSGNYLH